MSSIRIGDLAHSTALDCHAMAGVRGGTNWGPGINVNLTVDQKITQLQNVDVSVLNNNGIIGAGFTGPSIALSPQQWAKNEATLPGF